ncbi:hypothetical protein F5Y08DRAFT_350166 [Xylaria arbuscula]|nr:hypothetical protein F5Y08DRAFT_350166 [Xylaria arbuscula]
MASSTFDFVVVGGGPAGCAVAAGLARSPKKPSVLLLEAGSDNAVHGLRVHSQRFTTLTNNELNWGYKTSPQADCGGRVLDYSRGKGLGGSSAINFGVFSRGARDDYEEWARIVDDDTFGWDAMLQRFRDVESFDPTLPVGIDANKYSMPKASDHGSSGPLRVGYADEWDKDFVQMLNTLEQAGWPLNPDYNSGNPMGIAPVINSAYHGVRSTANDLLKPQPSNLTIVTGALVHRLILQGNQKVIGVEANDKVRYMALKEVVLSAGSLNTPSILMHSGIGPNKQLEAFQIPVIRNIEAIGQGLRDHMFVPLIYTRTETSTSKFELGIGYNKLEGLESTPEFNSLPQAEQNLLLKETVPHFEIITHFPVHHFIPDFPSEASDYLCILVFYNNAQSRGEATLQSADPTVPLKFDPKFLGSAFDRLVAVMSLREAMKIAKHPAYSKDIATNLLVPQSESDEDLLLYWQQYIGSSWHMTGTVKMGVPGDVEAAVDKDFKLMGFDGLRIADMSVVPVLANCHVQAVAYVTGMTCAERLIRDYQLS